LKLKALKTAFPKTLPVLAGFFFIGLSYGIYMHSCGFGFLYPLMMSLLIFGGSMQFALVPMLMSPFAPISTFLLTLMVQARHIFYGLSMVDRYKGLGVKKFYLIFGLIDETFSINCSAEIPEDVDKGWYMFFVTILNHIYWVVSSVLGSIFGSLINIDVKGISFVMTSMFVVIFLEQWLKDKTHVSAFIGLGASAVCLIVFGRSSFLIPTMAVIIVILAIFKKPLEALEVKKK